MAAISLDDERGERCEREVIGRVARERAPGDREMLQMLHWKRIQAWLTPSASEQRGLRLAKVQQLLQREGVRVPFSSLHRFAVTCHGASSMRFSAATVAVIASLGGRVGGRTLDSMTTPVSTFDEAVRRLMPKAAAMRALGVERLSVFGSVARGEPRSDSDADVLVRFAEGRKSFDRFLDLAELLEEALGRPVELVTVESLSPVLGPKILAEARDVVRAA